DGIRDFHVTGVQTCALPISHSVGFAVLQSPPPDKAVVYDLPSLRDEISRIRTHGYALLDEELELGVVGASAPVRDYTGRIIAAQIGRASCRERVKRAAWRGR